MSEDCSLHSKELEMSCLGSCMLSETAAAEVAAILKPEHFYFSHHRVIFAAVLALMKQGKPVDLLSMKNHLGAALGSFSGDDITEVGGEDYLIGVQEFVPSPANAAYYAGAVREKWETRQILEAAKRVQRLILAGDSPLAEIRSQAQAILEEHVVVAPAVTSLGDFPMDRRKGIPSIFGPINQFTTTRGYPCGQFSMVCGGEKDGKSSYLISELVGHAESDLRCLYATFADLAGSDIQKRALKNLTGIYDRPEEGAPIEEAASQNAAIDQAIYKMKLDWDVDVYDASSIEDDDGYDVETFCAWFRSQMPKRKYKVVYLDYAQELVSRDRTASDMVAQNTVCASKIRRLASRFPDTAFLVASQVTIKDGKARTQWSGAWIAKAGLVVVLDRKADDTVTVKIQESRFGPGNQTVRGVVWNPSRVRFERGPAA